MCLLLPTNKGYNAETEVAMEEARDIMNGKVNGERYASVDDMFSSLELND